MPIILGMVLGGIMEVKLRSAMARVKDPLDFIDRPIAAILFVMILGVLALHVRRVLLDRKERKAQEWSNSHASTSFETNMSRRKASLLKARGKQVKERRSTFSRRSTDKN